ncbi:MAG: hypothetical protein EOO99_09880 [Pedobacter sp.]|nr:MAG: hypothetical protein EOO99_09880 [Pedobacter sp.]
MNYRIAILCLMMVIVVAVRAFAPLSNDFIYLASFTGIGAVALFGGAYIKNITQAMILPIALLFISDLCLILTMGVDYAFGPSTPFMYGAFILMTLVGKLILRKVNVQNIVLASLTGVFIHWVVTDIPEWYQNPAYAQNLKGFWQVLVLAIPFERTFLVSTLVYSSIMFGAFEFIKVKFPSLAYQKIK